MENQITQEELAHANKTIRGFNSMLKKLGIVCFGFALTAIIQVLADNYSSAIFDGIVFLWLLNTVRKFNFLKENN